MKRILAYGAGGVGKSSLLAQLMAELFKRTGKKSRLVTADGGGTDAYQPLVERGICRIWDLGNFSSGSTSPFSVLDAATKGWFPGEDGALLPAVEEWRECLKCKGPAGEVGRKECLSCKAPIPPGTRLKQMFSRVNGAEEVELAAFEGITAFGSRLMDRLREVDPSGGRSIKDGDFSISALGQQHYGDAQSYSEHFVSNSRGLPYEYVFWTGHELRGADDGYGKPTYGPALPGKKLTALCIPWFTDVWHLDTEAGPVGTDGVQKRTHKLFTAEHFPADTKPFGFKAKSAAGMPEVIALPAGVNNAPSIYDALEKAKGATEKVLFG